MPQLQGDCRASIQRKFDGYLIEFIPQLTLSCWENFQARRKFFHAQNRIGTNPKEFYFIPGRGYGSKSLAFARKLGG